jgi:REP element-mobilizing transposase RayT
MPLLKICERYIKRISGNYDPEINHRRSIRLKEYDYSRSGAYFMTICTQDRTCLFGGINDGKMVLNDSGYMVQSIWNELPIHYAGVKIDQFIVMPNHIHAIIILSDVGEGLCACPHANDHTDMQFDIRGAGTPACLYWIKMLYCRSYFLREIRLRT